MTTGTPEYSYEKKRAHLGEREALDKYKRALNEHPDALIVLDDLPCGHWDVLILQTPLEKESYYKRRLSALYHTLFSPFTRLGNEHEIR